VAKAAPDGYTLLMNGNTFIIGSTLQKVPYDTMKSFTQIAGIGTGPTVLFVSPTFPANSVKELIALAKQKPGKLIFGSSGIGSGNHMAMELFKIMAGIDFKIVHFKGAGPALTDLLGGHVDAMFATIGQPLPHIKSGKVKGLGTGGVKRSASLPDLPTIAEAGVPGFEASQWWGIWGPAGIPAPIVDRLTKELKAILASDEVKKIFLADGSEAAYLTPTEFVPFLEVEIAKWTRVVKEANVKLEE
jgi:tripartite-type tricarboxylate transporter receptor subunit TctC